MPSISRRNRKLVASEPRSPLSIRLSDEQRKALQIQVEQSGEVSNSRWVAEVIEKFSESVKGRYDLRDIVIVKRPRNGTEVIVRNVDSDE